MSGHCRRWCTPAVALAACLAALVCAMPSARAADGRVMGGERRAAAMQRVLHTLDLDPVAPLVQATR